MTLSSLSQSLEQELENTDAFILGSFQYQTIGATQKWALKHLKENRELFEKLMGITYGHQLTLTEMETGLYETNDLYLKDIKDSISKQDGNYEQKELDEFIAFFNKYTKNKRLPISDCIEHEKDMSSDLWCSYIHPFMELNIFTLFDIPTLEPIFNQMAQSENFFIGISLAYMELIYGTDLSVFADFDT